MSNRKRIAKRKPELPWLTPDKAADLHGWLADMEQAAADGLSRAKSMLEIADIPQLVEQAEYFRRMASVLAYVRTQLRYEEGRHISHGHWKQADDQGLTGVRK